MRQNEQLSLEQKRFRTVGLVVFIVAAGLVALRIIVGLIPFPDTAAGDMLSDLAFTVPMQIGLMLLVPFFIYKKRLKKDFKGVMEFSNVRKTKRYNYLLAIPIGICVFIVTMGVSTVWSALLRGLGYKMPSGSISYPTKGGFWAFLLALFLTGVLPAICEEFTNRGGFLTTMTKSYKLPIVVLIGAIGFGLFHQNIRQVFYTACFGAFMTYLTVKTKSLFPAIIIHFINNGLNVYFEYAGVYGWFGGGIYDMINVQLVYNPLLLFGAYVIIVAAGIGLTMLMLHLMGKEKIEKKLDIFQSSGFDHTNKRVVLMGEENKALAEDIGMVKEVYGSAYVEEEKFKPSLRDSAFFIGAIAIMVLTTIFSLVFGFFY